VSIVCGCDHCTSPLTDVAIYSAPGTTFVTLATAHPAKFDAAVKKALPTSEFPDFDFDGQVLPDTLRQLAGLEKRVTRVKGEQGVRELIEKVAKESKEAAPTQEEGKGSM